MARLPTSLARWILSTAAAAGTVALTSGVAVLAIIGPSVISRESGLFILTVASALVVFNTVVLVVPITAISVAIMPTRSLQLVFAAVLLSALAVGKYVFTYGPVSPLSAGRMRIEAVILSGMLVAQIIHTALLSKPGA